MNEINSQIRGDRRETEEYKLIHIQTHHSNTTKYIKGNSYDNFEKRWIVQNTSDKKKSLKYNLQVKFH